MYSAIMCFEIVHTTRTPHPRPTHTHTLTLSAKIVGGFIFGDFNFVEDTVSGMIAIHDSQKSIGKTINIGSGYDVSIEVYHP